MFRFTKNIEDYGNQIFEASKYIGQGFSVTFDHMNRKPITIHYPYGELIPTERFRGRIHFEFELVKFAYVFVQLIYLLLIGNTKLH